MKFDFDAALAKIESTNSSEDCDQYMKAGKRYGFEEIYSAALRRKIRLSGVDSTDPLELAVEEAVTAREHLLYLKHGKKQKASYTRRMIDGGKPAKQTIIDWVMSTAPTAGFTDFVEAGIVEFAAENIAVRFADRFPDEVVEAAKARLQKYGQ
ncbi:hypothetical protein [Mesorhizobium sp.]|uniref:hypothetical protein n=1 Tax=Mesorhizobium sp. TaxID=1871066 RepID=UPI000FE9543A|nr:hypothetical protein [Mesorhizobium sp.]RWC26483.1 MAG: hypothetical protein EOS27_25100 [Mesorhizobium sp.]TIX28133.1 MAG: hypothetical protein E5V35_03605 [Mesorhizobium sp.]